MRLTDENFWAKGYVDIEFNDQSGHDVAVFLNKHLGDGKGKTCLEVGSFPGSFLPTVARKGYLVHGVDFNVGNSGDLPNWLKRLGLKVGSFWTGDISDFVKNNSQKFDLVCSFGFIEHFENYNEVIKDHVQLVKPDGKIIITTPNFRGLLQFLPHRIFDNSNLKVHYLPSMQPKVWKRLLEELGFEIEYYGYFGGYRFWVDEMSERSKMVTFFLRWTARVISQFNKLFRKLGWESSMFSAYCGIVANRR